MRDQKTLIRKGIKTIKKGYQPEVQPTTPTEPAPEGGYQPTTSEGDNSANEPSPPKEE